MKGSSSNSKPGKPFRSMASVTDQYRAANVQVTVGHQPNLEKVAVPEYTEEEHGTWSLMFERQMKALPERAANEYLSALEYMDLPPNRIPTLKEVSRKLETSTGWRVTRVDGLVPEREFFECLAQKLFPCTDFIRERAELDYTPSPDMFHDIFGHLPLISNPTFANFYEFYGKAALKCNPEQVVKLQRIYWFTVEFGLMRTPQGRRIYGSGILSSVGEVMYCLSDRVKVHPFDFEQVENQYFEIHHMQQELFEISSFDFLLKGFTSYAEREGLV